MYDDIDVPHVCVIDLVRGVRVKTEPGLDMPTKMDAGVLWSLRLRQCQD